MRLFFSITTRNVFAALDGLLYRSWCALLPCNPFPVLHLGGGAIRYENSICSSVWDRLSFTDWSVSLFIEIYASLVCSYGT